MVVQAFYNLSYSPDSYTHMNKVPKTCLFFQMHGHVTAIEQLPWQVASSAG